MNTYVFGYGSLINRMSIARTTVREPKVEELVANRLHGYGRIWDFKAQVRSELLGRVINGVFLNIRPDTLGTVNGVTFPVTAQELERLQVRERNYTMIECGADLEFAVPGRVVTFMCTQADHLAATGSEGAVLQRYIDIVDDGCNAFGEDFIQEFIRTTAPHSFLIVDGAYTFI